MAYSCPTTLTMCIYLFQDGKLRGDKGVIRDGGGGVETTESVSFFRSEEFSNTPASRRLRGPGVETIIEVWGVE